MNETIERFGYPDTAIREWEHWILLLRPAQPTLGSCILAAKSEATAFGDLPAAAHAELATVTAEVERALGSFTAYGKINYLMLMMKDPHVHFHVIPRYEGTIERAGIAVEDAGWPGPPALDQAPKLSPEAVTELRDRLSAAFVR